MADEVPAIAETSEDTPMETTTIATVANVLPCDLPQEKQLESQNQQQPEPVVQEAPNVSESISASEETSQLNAEGTSGGETAAVPQEAVVEKPPESEPPKVAAPPVKKINVFVKTPQEKESFEIEENAGVKDFKQLIAPKFNAEPDQLVLIFAGKIMDDSDTMQQHKVKDGLTIHLVIRIAETGPPRQSADISATPYGLGNLGGLVGLAQLGMGSPNFMELQNQMQNELLTNPNVLRNLLENPLVQELMTHTDVMRSLIMRNPQMQELIDRYVTFFK